MKEEFEIYLERLKTFRTEDEYNYTDQDFEKYIGYIRECWLSNVSVYKCLEFMYYEIKEEFDVENICDEIYRESNYLNDFLINSTIDVGILRNEVIELMKLAFNKHQELTKDRLYTIYQMKSGFYNGGDKKDEEDWTYFIKSLNK